MTEAESAQAFDTLLDRLGVIQGEVVYLGLDMGKLPLPHWPAELNRNAIQARNERWCEFVLERVMGKLGPEGTLLVGAFSYSCSDPANPFSVEETPSEIGPFTNWVRRKLGAVRSVHPVFSVAGLGKHAASILEDTGGSAFGPNSPFGRLAAKKTRFVNLGLPLRLTLTHVHHLEQCHGCNHRYNKVFQTKVYKQGGLVDRKFMGYMRWRGVDSGVNLKPLEEGLKEAGLLREVECFGTLGQSALCTDVERIGYAMLAQDSCVFSTNEVRIHLDDSEVATSTRSGPDISFRLVD